MSKVEENLISKKMIDRGDVIIVGVSGGFDSMMLLDILYRLKDKYGYSIKIAHINHGVRGKEADQDEEFVRQNAKRYGLEFYSKTVDMNGYAKKYKMTAEEAGRKLRYEFFNSIEKKNKYKIAVAHNKNDIAETILMRIIRGTGVDGLSGIDYKRDNIIRPILNISREDIEYYCEKAKLNPRLDRTNLEPIYYRNKIRLDLIPYIEKEYSKNIVESLFRLSENIKEDIEILNNITDEELEDVLISRDRNKIVLDNERFKYKNKGLKSRILRRAIEIINGNIVGIERININDILHISKEANTGKSLDLKHGIKARLSYDKLYIEKCENNGKVRYNYKIALNCNQSIPEINKTIKTEIVDIKDLELDKKDRNIEYFDFEKIEDSIIIRNRNDGDRVKFLGMKGRKKLKDFFIDNKINREERDKIPLIIFEEEIAWIVGYRRADIANIDKNTKRVLKVSIE